MELRAVVAAGLAMAAVTAGCSTDRVLTSPEPEPVTEERLTDALLAIDDLPGGFSEDPAPVTAATEMLPEHACDDRLAGLRPEAEVSRSFQGGANRLSSTVAWFPGAGAAVEQVVRRVASDCAAVVIAGEGLAVRTGPLRFGVLSDDTIPIRMEIEPDTGPIQERDLILVREGDLVNIIRLEGPRPSDKSLLDLAARLAIGRLSLLHEQTT